jgi:NAD(P)H-quinone oxidoreductase subunit 5
MADFLVQYAVYIPLYGLIGAVLSLPWSLGLIRKTGPRPAAYVNLFMTLLGFVQGGVTFLLLRDSPPIDVSFDWLQVADLNLSLAFELSPISLGAMELVTGISLLAQVYALGYMEKDWSLARFYGLMGFFEAALSGLVISDSLLLSYALLELLTLSTYLLVGFWYAQPLVVTAARDAFLTKRVGDIILLMGIVALSSYGDGLTFSELETWGENSNLPVWIATLLGIALIAGPTGKCAQFPLNLWLDEAMEGPNPAGIMRNSIVVSAGAYVLIKLQPVFALSPIASDVLIVIGAVTAIGASLVAIAQTDIKRTLSHSTSAYLGLVFIAVGFQQVDIAFLILLTHALAKALLFMSIGSVILTTSNQNITEMGGLWSKMPATTTSFLVGSAGLVSLLPLGTFWTMRRWVNGFWEIPLWLLGILLLVNALSALNLTRVFRLVFLGETRPKTRRAPEAPWSMAVPMVSLIIVNLLVPLILQHWQSLITWNSFGITDERLLIKIAVPLLILSSIIGITIGSIWKLDRAMSRPTQFLYRLVQDVLAYDFYIDKIYNLTIVKPVALLSQWTSWLDRYVVDGLVNLTGFAALFSGTSLKYNVSGQSQFYVLTILVAIGLLLIWSVATGQWSVVVNYWSSVFQ